MQRIKLVLQQQQQDSINKSPMFFAYFRGFDTNGLLADISCRPYRHLANIHWGALGYWKWQAEHLAEARCLHLHPINAIFYGRPSPYGRLSFLG